MSVRFRSSTLGLRANLHYWYDARKGFKGKRPFTSSNAVRLIGEIWRGSADLSRIGDTVEYRLRKTTLGRSVK